jgi:uncharacterized protein (DUF2062 family)
MVTAGEFVRLHVDGSWEALTQPGSEAYHPLWAPLLIGELVGEMILCVIGLVALVLFLRRSWRTPTWMIVWYGSSFALSASVGAVLGNIPDMVDSNNIGSVLRAAAVALIWIPYFMRSKRVKATFVRPVDPTKPLIPRAEMASLSTHG